MEIFFIETPRSRIKQRAKVTNRILLNVVNAEASWWFPEKPGELSSLFGALESDVNMSTIDNPDARDPLTGGWCNRPVRCKVYKVEE